MSHEKASELKALAEKWYYREFSEVPLQLVEIGCREDNPGHSELYQYIEPLPIEEIGEEWWNNLNASERKELEQEGIDDGFLNDKNDDQDIIDYAAEEKEDVIREWYQDYRGDEHYPMWGTLFVSRCGMWSTSAEQAQAAGFLVAQNVPFFEGKTILGVAGCGYSFHGAHWIPLYLSILSDDDRKQWDGVDYSMM